MAAVADPKGADVKSASRWENLAGAGGGYVPGLALAIIIAAAAFGVRLAPGFGSFSPMIIAIGLGVVMGNLVGVPDNARAGLAFTMRRLLRLAIVLLGLQLTASQVIAVGAGGIIAIIITLVATFAVTTWLGRLLGVDARLTQLIAAGTSICGASAIMAANTVTRAPDEDVTYAVACVTLFGTIAMLAYPLLPGLLDLDALAYGLWSGASIHEIAQVVGASFAQGQEAGEFGTVAKLARVMMLAPVIIALGLIAARSTGTSSAGRASVQTPWFVIGFVGLVVVNSLFAIPVEVKELATPVTTFLLTVALAAMGIGADISKLRARGVRPLLLGLCSFLFIACFSLVLVKLLA